MKRSIALIVMLFVFAIGISVSEAQGSRDYSKLKVLAVTPLEIPFGLAHVLSPDGQRVAVYKRRELCVYSLQGQEIACGDLNAIRTGVDESTLAWSPDGTRLVFHDNFFIQLREPDLYLMDAQTGALTALTPDQNLRVQPSDLTTLQSIDIAPAWSLDGTQIAFIRYTATLPAIYTISASGGTPILQTPIVAPTIGVVSLAWAPQGDRFAFIVSAADPSLPANGVWITDLDGDNSRQLLRQRGLASVSFSTDGRYLLTQDMAKLGAFTNDWKESTSILIDTQTGERIAIDDEVGAHFASFAPDGNAIMYISYPDGKNSVVKLAEAPGGTTRTLYDEAPFITPDPRAWRGVEWRAPNAVLLADQARKLVLVTLGE